MTRATRLNPMLTEIQQHHEEPSGKEERSLHQLAESIRAVFWMTDNGKNRLLYVSPGYEKIWGRTCASLYASARGWMDAVHVEDRNRVLEASLTKQATGEYDEEYRVVRPDGAIRWVRDRAFPICNPAGEVYRIAGIAEDITERKSLGQAAIEMGDSELCRLGQDLHDGICQQLVSIAFATDLLRRDLVVKSPPEAVRVARITALLDNVITQARNLAHTLSPVNLVGNGLGIALRELALSVSRGFHLVCEADCAEGLLIPDRAVATHLYRIAQEAVQHATKHANATRILISLHQTGDSVQLSITDNGLEAKAADGGLSVMKYRAGMAGGTLEIQRNPFGGTIVSCICPQKMA
jgi:PAS domain S-box-containing protein